MLSHTRLLSFLITLAFFFLSASVFAYNQSEYQFASNNDASRFDNILNETRCIVCQNQTLADSDAPLANDLRDKIYHLVLENKSDAEINDFLTSRYGEFILLRPRLQTSTMTLWFFPFFALLTAFVFLIRLKHK